MDLKLIMIAKQMNLSFFELNELRNRDLLELADIYCGEKETKTREATQDDIDKFYA